MDTSLKFSLVNQSQVQLLQKISIKTFKQAFGNDNTKENLLSYLDKSFNIGSLLAQINHPNSKFYFVYLEKVIVGYFKINIGESQTELQKTESLELERIYIYKVYQNKGFGKIILNEVKNLATIMQKNFVWLGVWEHNLKAISFYQNFGFQKFDEHIYIIGNDPQTDWMMQLMI